MIQRPREAPVKHRFTAYDFEWRTEAPHQRFTKGGKASEEAELTPYLAGAYDERGYRWYPRLSSFLRGELTRENCGRRYYAHFGGASDMVFLLKELMKDQTLSIRAIFSGSSAIVVSVARGDDYWLFCDSFWLMRVSLKKIGKWLGHDKLVLPSPDAPWSEQLTYNERDCEILHRAISDFQETILDKGGQLCVTAASTALDMFLRRYLERPIANSPAIDAWCRPAYVASRVEMFRETCERANVYDINSSFPYSMTFPIPGDFLSMCKTLPESGLWVADCDVVVPEQDVPPLPYRGEDNRLYFPTGKMRTRITCEDLLCGDFEVLKVYNCWRFEERLDMAQYARDFYQLRLRGGFEAEVYKILLNSLYGKLAERDEKQILLINPEQRPDPMHAQVLFERAYLVDQTIDVPHSHVAAPAIITARSRRFLREGITRAWSQGPVYYSDTDSVICAAELEDCPGILGKFKKEPYNIRKGRFHGSKLWAAECDDGADIIRAKGFSRKVGEGGEREGLTYADFTSLSEGESLRIERMLRIKELLRREGGEYTPVVARADKRLLKPRPKRRPDGSGGSTPWTVRELAIQ